MSDMNDESRSRISDQATVSPGQTQGSSQPATENAVQNEPRLNEEEMRRALQLSIEAAERQRDRSDDDHHRKAAGVSIREPQDFEIEKESREKTQTPPGWHQLPSEWRDRLLAEKNAFVLREDPKVTVFSTDGNALRTKLNNPEVAQLLAATADERGWGNVRVSGTDVFRREVWVEGTARGIGVSGYRPTEVDYQEASLRARQFEARNKVRADQKALENLEPGVIARRSEEHRNAAAAIGATAAHLKDTVKHASDRRVLEQAVRDRLAASNGRSAREIKMRDPAGKIIGMGFANYRFDANESRSFFVRLEKDGKTRDLWGVGLSDATTEAKVAKGDYVTIRQVGQSPVMVNVARRNREGQIVGIDRKEVMRNDYKVSRQVATSTPGRDASTATRRDDSERTQQLSRGPSR